MPEMANLTFLVLMFDFGAVGFTLGVFFAVPQPCSSDVTTAAANQPKNCCLFISMQKSFPRWAEEKP